MTHARGALVIVLLLGVLSCTEQPMNPGISGHPPNEASFVEVSIGGTTLLAELADTPARRAEGLSGRDSLGRDHGMWFDLGEVRPVSFWMKGMRFPIDIIWISQDLAVMGFVERAAVPRMGDASVPYYESVGPVRYVLEVNADFVREMGIAVGDRAEVRMAQLR